MLRQGGLGKGGGEGYGEVEVGEDDQSGEITQRAARRESTGWKVGEGV